MEFKPEMNSEIGLLPFLLIFPKALNPEAMCDAHVGFQTSRCHGRV